MLGDSAKITQVINAAAARSLQSCPTLCDSIDGSPPGSTVPGKNTGVGCHCLLRVINGRRTTNGLPRWR